MRTLKSTLVVVLGASLWAACGGLVSSAPASPPCMQDDSVACTAPEGCAGSRACNVAGTLDPCMCGPAVYIVTTLAGSGAPAFADGAGAEASLQHPRGVAVDASGNVYVADSDNHRIRKVTSAGVATTLAGSDTAAATDGTGAAASFYTPWGVAVDGAGNVYVGDYGNQAIRKVTAAGVVTTLAGSGMQGLADGMGAAAGFALPEGVAVDADGNVFVADSYNMRIRKVSPAGLVTTIGGSHFAPEWVSGVAVDAAGNLYAAETDGRGDVYNRIRKVSSAGVVTTLAGSGMHAFADGIGAAASFDEPNGVAVDASGNVYVADTTNRRIRKVTAAGVVTTIAGSGAQAFADGTGEAASFSSPRSIAVDAVGNLYVADDLDNRIRKLTRSADTSH